MPIINIYPNDPGHAADVPSVQRIETNDTIATVTATGYLNHAVQSGLLSVSETDIVLVATSSVAGKAADQTGWYEVSYSAGNWSLVQESLTPSDVVLLNPSADQTITAHNLIVGAGNLQAGKSGAAGALISYPSTASKGYLEVAAVDNTGNTAVILSNVAHGQATTYSIPDCGNAAGRILNAATATPFTTGHLIASSGTGGLTADSGIATTNVVSKAAANTFSAGGSIILNKVNGTESGNAVTASGVAGVITTSSLSTVGGASYAITWTNTAITSTSVITLTTQGGTNTTQNYKMTVVPGSGTATLTIYNLTAATSLDGTILIGYLVM
jgi:hypothetical protein